MWGKGTKEEADELNLPLLSIAVDRGLFHPNCRHRVTTYFYDLKEEQGKLEDDGIEITHEEQEARKKRLLEQKKKRLEEGSLDSKNIAESKQRKEMWIEKDFSIEEQNKINRNYGRDLAQYERYKEVLGSSNLPKTFEEFRELKYNDIERWKLFVDYKNSRKSNMISVFTSFEQYVDYKKRIDEEIVGLITKDGIEIKSQSKHFIERVMGTSEDPKSNRPRDGVDLENIKDAIVNGEFKKNDKDDSSISYIGKNCSVSINKNTGKLIQVNPISRKRKKMKK